MNFVGIISLLILTLGMYLILAKVKAFQWDDIRLQDISDLLYYSTSNKEACISNVRIYRVIPGGEIWDSNGGYEDYKDWLDMINGLSQIQNNYPDKAISIEEEYNITLKEFDELLGYVDIENNADRGENLYMYEDMSFEVKYDNGQIKFRFTLEEFIDELRRRRYEHESKRVYSRTATA